MAPRKTGVAVDGYIVDAFDRIYGDAFAKEAAAPEWNGMREPDSRQPRNDDFVRHAFDAVIDKVADLLLEQQNLAEHLKAEYTELLAGLNHGLVVCERILGALRVHLAPGHDGRTGDCNSVMLASDDVVAVASVVHGPSSESEDRVALSAANRPFDARLAQLKQAVADGQLQLTVVGIRHFLRCSQATAIELRRELLAQRVSKFRNDGEV
jgi:hypothetical protein